MDLRVLFELCGRALAGSGLLRRDRAMELHAVAADGHRNALRGGADVVAAFRSGLALALALGRYRILGDVLPLDVLFHACASSFRRLLSRRAHSGVLSRR